MTAILPGPGIELDVSIGVGQSKFGGVWDTGKWDVNSWGQTDTSLGDWVDITCYVTDTNGVQLAAGASNADGVVTRWEAATCAFQTIGKAFDPRSGPWTGLLGPGLPVRVRWRPIGGAWLVAFNGYVDDTGFTYDPKTALASIAATDGTRIFNGFDGVEQAPIGANETAAQRVTRIADMVGWPATQRDIAAGGVTVQATTLADNAWTLLLAVADTDLALLWLTRAGFLAYRPQGKVIPNRKIDYTIGCANDPKTIRPVDMRGQQPTMTRNVVSISRQGGGTVTLQDDGSVARYLPHTYKRTDLIHTDDAWSTRVAQAVLQSSAWPATAPESVSLNSRVDYRSTALLLALEPSLSLAVSDGVRTWQVEPAGWDVNIHRDSVAGDIKLLDVTPWYGSAWDSAKWDTDKWGF